MCPNSKARRQSGGKDSVPGGEEWGKGFAGRWAGGGGVADAKMQKLRLHANKQDRHSVMQM